MNRSTTSFFPGANFSIASTVMIRARTLFSAAFLLMVWVVATSATAAPTYPKAVVPDSVEVQQITIWSDGRALDGAIYRPTGLAKEDKLPAIVTSHGWGGDKNTASRYAVKFASAGFIVVTFTHSSWGNSQGYMVQKNPVGSDIEQGSEVDIHEVKNIIDPVDWSHNFRAAIDYLTGEPNVDVGKIGGWGTSFGGGIAAFNAANDKRVASLVLQVPAFPTLKGQQLALAQQRAIDVARGRIAAIPEGLDTIPGLDGTPHFARFLQYHPMESVERIQAPTLFIAAEKENLFNNEEHSGKAFKILENKKNLETEYHLIPEINHYGIYFDGFETGSELAVAWFEKTLK